MDLVEQILNKRQLDQPLIWRQPMTSKGIIGNGKDKDLLVVEVEVDMMLASQWD